MYPVIVFESPLQCPGHLTGMIDAATIHIGERLQEHNAVVSCTNGVEKVARPGKVAAQRRDLGLHYCQYGILNGETGILDHCFGRMEVAAVDFEVCQSGSAEERVSLEFSR